MFVPAPPKTQPTPIHAIALQAVLKIDVPNVGPLPIKFPEDPVPAFGISEITVMFVPARELPPTNHADVPLNAAQFAGEFVPKAPTTHWLFTEPPATYAMFQFAEAFAPRVYKKSCAIPLFCLAIKVELFRSEAAT